MKTSRLRTPRAKPPPSQIRHLIPTASPAAGRPELRDAADGAGADPRTLRATLYSAVERRAGADPREDAYTGGMATSPKQRRLGHQAKQLYSHGLGFSEIAKNLGIGRDTIRAWHAKEREAWDTARDEAQTFGHLATYKALQLRFARLAQAGPPLDASDIEAEPYEARLLKLAQTIHRFETTADEITQTLLALERLAEWCAASLSSAHLAVVRNVLMDYTDDLRRRNT